MVIGMPSVQHFSHFSATRPSVVWRVSQPSCYMHASSMATAPAELVLDGVVCARLGLVSHQLTRVACFPFQACAAGTFHSIRATHVATLHVDRP